jgi:mannose-6-phosphate isomerase-like protein (cupin superfamily)
LKCKELVYIIEGSGRVIFENKKINLKPGDLVLIKPKEKIYWDGNLTMFVTSTPAWYLEQHKEVE